MESNEVAGLVERIRNFNATVFVLFMGGSPVKLLSEALNERGVMGKIWVASEAWATSRSVLESGGKEIQFCHNIWTAERCSYVYELVLSRKIK